MLIVFRTATDDVTLEIEEENAIKKGLRLLQLVGNEEEQKEAISLLEQLGESIQQRPNFEHGGPG
jgi:hypothetical protein